MGIPGSKIGNETMTEAVRASGVDMDRLNADLKRQLQSLDRTSFPNIAVMRDSYLAFTGEAAFHRALELILSGMALDRDQAGGRR